MKTIQVAIISIAALTLSGCATGYYQRDYVGYGGGYSSPAYRQSYSRSYASPGTSISIGRYYTQPSYGQHHDYHVPEPHVDHHERGRGWGWGHRGFGREHHAEHAPRQQSRSEGQGRGFGRYGNGGEHRQRGGHQGRHGD